MGCHFLLQRIFPTQGSNLGLPNYKQMIYRLSHRGSDTIEVKCTINVVHLKHPKTISPTRLPQNGSLVPKSLGTTGVMHGTLSYSWAEHLPTLGLPAGYWFGILFSMPRLRVWIRLTPGWATTRFTNDPENRDVTVAFLLP